MIARPGPLTTSCNAGEMSRDVAGRVNIKQYYEGGLSFKNIEPVPQSGFKLMAGSRDLGPVRGDLRAVATAPVSSDGSAQAGEHTIVEASFAAAPIAAVLIAGVKVSAGTFSMRAQLRVGGVWNDVGGSLAGATIAIERLAGRAPGTPLTADRVRVLLTASDAAAAVTVPAVTVFDEGGAQRAPRYRTLPVDDQTGYFLSFGGNFVDIWKDDGWVAAVYLPDFDASMLTDVDFYAEDKTVGIFHTTLETVRIRRAGVDNAWEVDLWPYDGVPKADLGGVYPKTDDKWDLFIRWANNPNIYLQVTIDEETTQSLPLVDSTGTKTTAGAASPNEPDWTVFANDIAAAINDLASIPGGVTASGTPLDGGDSGAATITITFGGDSSGVEHNLSAIVTNTADASVLPTHSQVGKTDGEAIVSGTRGWPGTAALVQDRLAYARMPAVKAAIALSKAAEYFTLNIEQSGDSAARLDRLRSQTSQIVYRMLESLYFVVFTNSAVWFASNRTITATQPLNYTLTSERGIRVNTDPIDLESQIYYVSENGLQVLSLAYDDISTKFTANPESLLASHLIIGILRTARQTSTADTDANKMWLLRDDGRLICGSIIKDQDILGFCEWIAADAGAVREIATDYRNVLRVAVDRGGAIRHEILDPDQLFQAAVTTTTDLAGRVTGLAHLEGASVWAEADGYVLGPFIVAGGAIDLGHPYATVHVGRWTAPIWRSMPHVYVNSRDQILRRPGRIHTLYLNVIDTTSVAVGANNGEAVDIALLETGDPVDAPLQGKTKMVMRQGILGTVLDTTAVITQVRPGRLRVRDITFGEKL